MNIAIISLIFFSSTLLASDNTYNKDEEERLYLINENIYEKTAKEIPFDSSYHFYYENFYKGTGTFENPRITIRRPAETRTVLINSSLEDRKRKSKDHLKLQKAKLELLNFSSGKKSEVKLSKEEINLIYEYTNLPIFENIDTSKNISKTNAKHAAEIIREAAEKLLKSYREQWEKRKEYRVKLSMDFSGLPSITFSWETGYCLYDNLIIERVMMVNNQNVKFNEYCSIHTNKYVTPNENTYTIYTIPKSRKGMDYVINQFKKKEWVTVSNVDHHEIHKIKFWAKGFLDAYKELGVDAI